MQSTSDKSSDEEIFEESTLISSVSDILCSIVKKKETNLLINILKLNFNLDETNIIRTLR